MRCAVLCLALVAAGCSSATHETREPFSLGGGGAREPFSPQAFAARHPQPLECEVFARQLQARSRDQAWNVLKACVDTGNFWPLRALLTPAWLPDLRFRPDAANVLAKVVASRGGEVQQDLALLHDARLPLFSLEDGLEEPDLYRGRLILVRARVEELRKENGKVVAALAEHALASERRIRQVSPSAVDEQTISDREQAPQVKGRAPAGAYGRSSTFTDEQRVDEPFYENVSVDTGRLALATLPNPDPFLEPGQEFLFLARFDGLAPADDPRDAPVARLTLVSFEKPAGLVLY